MDLTAFRPARPLGSRRGGLRPAADSQLRELSRQIAVRSDLAGDYAHLLEPVSWLPVVSAFLPPSTPQPIPSAPIIWSYQGSGKSFNLISAALRAERLWGAARVHQRRRTLANADFMVVDGQQRVRALFEAKCFKQPSSPCVTPVAPLAPMALSGTLTADQPLDAPKTVEAKDWPALVTDPIYWRRTADELWRLASVPAQLSPEPAEAVVLDTSPCGIRRLTAVRVPRAPGCVRTSSIPNSSVLAAA